MSDETDDDIDAGEEKAKVEEESVIKSKNISSSSIKILRVLVILAIIVFAVIKIVQAKPQWFGLSSDKNTQAEVKDLVDKVGKIYSLPDEAPTVATVTDKERLSGQKFFERAENGDKILIFSGAKEAILYRPSENKVIQVGAVNLNQQPDIEGDDVINPNPNPSTITPLPTLKPT